MINSQSNESSACSGAEETSPVRNGSEIFVSPPAFQIGRNAEVDPNVQLSYRYPDWSEPAVIGNDAVIRSGSVIYADTRIGNRFTCGHNVVVRAKTLIGDDVVLLHQTTLEGNLRIGNGVKVMAHVYISSTTQIDDLVFIGPGVNFLNAKYPMRQNVPVRGARILSGVSIGGGVTICPGVTIGQGSLIAAGAVVTKDIPAHTLAMGVPARCYPLPADIPEENVPEMLLGSSDLWGKKSRDGNLALTNPGESSLHGVKSVGLPGHYEDSIKVHD